MKYKEALDLVNNEPIEKLVFPKDGRMEYAPAVDALLMACLDDFDMSIYDDYVKEAKFRPELLELKEKKKKVSEFSKQDLQLFLAIQQKAEAVMAGQIATIVENKLLVEVAEEIKK
ncbi:MAG: hypothetical protein ACK5MJ_07965 [Alphaproteobacteria bacterium]